MVAKFLGSAERHAPAFEVRKKRLRISNPAKCQEWTGRSFAPQRGHTLAAKFPKAQQPRLGIEDVMLVRVVSLDVRVLGLPGHHQQIRPPPRAKRVAKASRRKQPFVFQSL